MVLSKGLVISLGFSALSCTLLFLYFRNKMTTMERKVNVMFDIVQNYQPVQQYSEQQFEHNQQEYTQDNLNNESNENSDNNQNTGAWNLNAQDDRIVISDDSDDDDDDDDSEEVSDSDSEDEEIPKLSLAKTDNISLTENDIKKISVKEVPIVDNNVELEEVDSLDEIDDDDEDEDENDTNNDDNNETNNSNNDVKTISVTKNDTENNNEDDDVEDENDSNNDDDVDYTQLKVSELKAIAEAKGLTNYKSLKKTPLIELIKSSE